MRHSYHWPRLQRAGERRMDRDQELVDRSLARLVLGDANAAVDDVGPTHFHNIAAALAGIEQQSECEPLARAKRPAAFELRDLRVRPSVISAEPIRFQARE